MLFIFVLANCTITLDVPLELFFDSILISSFIIFIIFVMSHIVVKGLIVNVAVFLFCANCMFYNKDICCLFLLLRNHCMHSSVCS